MGKPEQKAPGLRRVHSQNTRAQKNGPRKIERSEVMRWMLMAWREKVCCFVGLHQWIKIRNIMPFCRCCGKARWL